MELWEWSLSVVNDSEAKARIIGAKNFMKCSGSCLAVSLDIHYYNRQTTYRRHYKKKVLQLVKVCKSFTCIYLRDY